MMQFKRRPRSGQEKPGSGQQSQDSDERSRNPDNRSQNPDDYTLYKPPEIPLEDSLKKPLKNSAEAESLHKLDHSISGIIGVHPFEKPIFCQRPNNLPYAFLGQKALAAGRISSFVQGRIIKQSEDQSLDEFISSIKGAYHDVVTLDDLHLAKRINSAKEVSGITAAYDWKQVCEACEENGLLFDVSNEQGRVRAIFFGLLAKEFIAEQDPELIKFIVDSHDPDVTLRALGHDFLRYYRQEAKRMPQTGFSESQRVPGFYAGLELLVTALQNAKDMIPEHELKSGIDGIAVESVCEKVQEVMSKTERQRYDHISETLRDRHWDRRVKAAWGSDDHDNDSSLSAWAKTKLFMKSMARLKAAGMLATTVAVDREGNIVAVCGELVKDVYWRKSDESIVASFFSKRPWLSAKDVAVAFRTYAGMFILGHEQGEAFKKSAFYCTKMVGLSWFFSNLKKIVGEIESRGAYNFRYLFEDPKPKG